MSLRVLANFPRDNETGELSGKCSYSGLNPVLRKEEQAVNSKNEKVSRKLDTHSVRQVPYEESNSSLAFSTSHEPTVPEQGQSQIDESTTYSHPSLNPAPICRQFWKAGNYDPGQVSASQLKSGKTRIQVHPMFLHSNATSHKWVFGAVAELIDNAIDEVQNGATLVIIDKTINPRDRSPALLVQDNGGGMDPESLKRCMSFGFSDKKMTSAIGQYGNGFKTSSMRLGADAIVFTRNLKDRTLTQSVGLLSYTFLQQTCHGEVVVPMVDYMLDLSTETFGPIFFHGQDHFSSNLSMLLQWSPYSTEEMLIKQFDDIGPHGTKVVVYNLWSNDDGDMELDFDTDVEDIRVRADPKLLQADRHSNPVADQHIANLYRYSLRVYSSILYLQLPQSFKIVLRGRVVEHHSIARDLKYPEVIQYKPYVGNKEATIITNIGFLKEAPHVNIHGFNVYHKNRLILPFWRVVKSCNGSARGVVGVLEANFVQPTHNKQDFEKTSLFQKLEARLKQMTLEYWYYHCGLIGYQQAKKSSPVSKPSENLNSSEVHNSVKFQPVTLDEYVTSVQGLNSKRKEQNLEVELEHRKRHRGLSPGSADSQLNAEKQQPTHGNEDQLQGGKIATPMQENRRLLAELSELERGEDELNMKVQRLKGELGDVQFEYARLLIESKAMAIVMDG